MKAILLFTTIILFFQSCSKEELELKQDSGAASKMAGVAQPEITLAYFIDWVSGVRGGGGGTDFFIELKAPLPEEMALSSVVFRGKQAKIYALSEVVSVANFTDKIINPEDQVEQSETSRLAGPLPDDQALLVYYVNGEINYHTITKVEERQKIQDPE